MRGSSLPELLVAMILAGLVLFSAYEGLTLLQRWLGSTSHASASWQLIQADAVVERLMRQADSIIHSDSELLFYSSGVCSDTLAADAPRAVMASDVGKGMGETDYRISL